MSTSFEKYNDILLAAHKQSNRAGDVAIKKKEIFDELFDHFNIESGTILFVGFNPAILKLSNFDICVTEVSDEVREVIDTHGVKYTYIKDIKNYGKKFAVVSATDEYFTFAATDQQQRDLVETLASVTENLLITTLRDYKNQDFKDREFSLPILVRNVDNKAIYFEHYEYDLHDRNNFYGTNYIVTDETLDVIGPFERRTMYFKQLAKFSFDNGAKNFLVHQNLMHKSTIKKNYEHILTIKF